MSVLSSTGHPNIVHTYKCLASFRDLTGQQVIIGYKISLAALLRSYRLLLYFVFLAGYLMSPPYSKVPSICPKPFQGINGVYYEWYIIMEYCQKV